MYWLLTLSAFGKRRDRARPEFHGVIVVDSRLLGNESLPDKLMGSEVMSGRRTGIEGIV